MENAFTLELYKSRGGKYWLRFYTGKNEHGQFWGYQGDNCGGYCGITSCGVTAEIARVQFQHQLDCYKASGINLIRCA